MNSNKYLKNIIREEIQLIKEEGFGSVSTPSQKKSSSATPKPAAGKSPFKTQAEADQFRGWYISNFKTTADAMGLKPVGSMSEPVLVTAYNQKKSQYASYKQQMQAAKTGSGANKDGQTGLDIPGLGHFTTTELVMSVIGIAIGGFLLVKGIKLGRWAYKLRKEMSERQAMNVLQNQQALNTIQQKAKTLTDKQLRAELKKLNLDEIPTDEEVTAIRRALGNRQVYVSTVITARRTVLKAFQDAIKQGKLPTYSADKIINTLTPTERTKYANTIRDLYAKALKKKQRIHTAKKITRKVVDTGKKVFNRNKTQ
jgi:hypothetical protein